MTILSFDEWKAKYITITPQCVKDLKEFHNVDAHVEIDKAVRPEYDQYVASQGDTK